MHFLVRTERTRKLFIQKYFDIFAMRRPEFSSKARFFQLFLSFYHHFKFKFRNVKVLKTDILGSEDLILVTKFDSFSFLFSFCYAFSSYLKCQSVKIEIL